MAMLRMLMHSQCVECKAADDILGFANRQLCSEAVRHDGTFVTAFYGIYNPVDRSLQYACAGHHPPLLVDRRTQVRELDEAQSLPLGVDPSTPFPLARATLSPGDTLLLYTDGITEATNPADEMYGRRRLLSCVREDVPNAQHIIDCVSHKLLAFTGDTTRDDDQTLLALRVR
jgi:sigma-B regulation protein RsbU (phosphoserine phosphatase)